MYAAAMELLIIVLAMLAVFGIGCLLCLNKDTGSFILPEADPARSEYEEARMRAQARAAQAKRAASPASQREPAPWFQ